MASIISQYQAYSISPALRLDSGSIFAKQQLRLVSSSSSTDSFRNSATGFIVNYKLPVANHEATI
ncbi:hypothetical protein Slin15195_G063060 [Septoria linicola]|uniref:Uncharacterized protein n=1 Tax=Septoria linicola TaxID=215465 RepID=A0A9Q9ANX7_9PEZI|nr:hypothetical protein Slin15195_G063060 [Septoria linicola]